MTRRVVRVVTAALLTIGAVGCAATDPSDSIAVTSLATGALSDAEILYGYRCKGCHEPATPGAPPREKLATWKPQKIQRALASGKMQALSVGLSQQQMRDLAVFLASPPRASAAQAK